MKTSSWFLSKGEPGRIGISVGTPRGQPPGFRLYRPLNPTRAMLQLSRPAYERAYFGMLAELSPRRVWDDLHRLAGEAEPILLCYERPPFIDGAEGSWCHRRMVAAWLEATLGHQVPELNHAGPDLPLTVDPRVGRDLT